VKDDGRFLQEVRVCLTTDLKPRDCDRPGDTRDKTIIVRPVR
jgi:ribonuclease I